MKSILPFFRNAPGIHSTGFLLLALFTFSGNSFGQNETDSLEVLPYPTDSGSAEFQYDSSSFSIDTIPRFYNYIAEFGFGLAFPLRDFHASDPTNEFAGYALQGYSFSAGLFLGFSEGGEAGWFFGAAYSGFRKSSDFTDTLRSVLSAFAPEESADNGPRIASLADDYRPRYDLFSLRTGFAFEGSDARVSAFGSLLLTANFSRLNRIPLGITNRSDEDVRFRSVLSTGFSATFGLRFQEQLSIGLSFHYLGAPDLFMQESDHRFLPEGAVEAIPLQRRIHFTEVKLGYGIAKRSGEREPKVKLRY